MNVHRLEQVAGSDIPPQPHTFHVASVQDFAEVEEAGVAALLGDDDDALIPEGADVVVYGDGGVGKTTLVTDCAYHLAAGDPWLGISVPRPLRVLMIENEGPRPLFRAKLRAKLASWHGSPIGDRLLLLEEPWAQFSFAEPRQRDALALLIAEREIDAVIIGPVTASGMEEAGTLQEVRAFADLLAEVREVAGRRVTFILVHHEAKGGKVSGAWEGCGDTLLHVQREGHGRTRVHVQKARWASSLHQRTLQLAWADEGGGFTLIDADARDAQRAAKVTEALEWIVAYVNDHQGLARSKVEAAYVAATGYKGARARAREAIDQALQRLAEWQSGAVSQTASPPLLATTSGESPGGTYLIPFADAGSPLAEPLFGDTGEQRSDPEHGRRLANSPPAYKAASEVASSADGVATSSAPCLPEPALTRGEMPAQGSIS